MTQRILALVLLAYAAKPLVATEAPEEDGVPPPPERVVRLWPLLSAEREPDGTLRTEALFSLYYSRSGPNEGYLHVLPLFWNSYTRDPPTRSLGVVPFYFLRKGPWYRDDVVFPLLWYHRSLDSRHFFLLNLFGYRETSGETQYHAVAPLFRTVRERERDAFRVRVGVPYLLELFEARRTGRHRSAAALNLFNFHEEARCGLPLFRTDWRTDGTKGSTHLFPLFWHGRSDGTGWTWLLPLYGHVAEGGGRLHVILPAGAWWTAEPEGHGGSWNVLFGLLGQAGRDGFSETRLLPFYWRRDGMEEGLRYFFPFYGEVRRGSSVRRDFLTIAYRRSRDPDAQEAIDDILYPLISFQRSPERIHRRILPFYIENREDPVAQVCILPFYYGRTRTVGGKVAAREQFIFPSWYRRWSADRKRSVGFPLWWSGEVGDTAYQVAFPLYWNLRRGEERQFHVLPLYSEISRPDRTRRYVLGPVYVESLGATDTARHLLWPLFSHETSPERQHHRAAPVYWHTREGDTSWTVVFPFLYRYHDPERSELYFPPVYGDYRRGGRERKFFLGASYIRSRDRSSGQEVVRARDDILWGLAGSLRDHEKGIRHHRFLPLWWYTRSPEVDRTVAFPLYYHHEAREEKRRSLSLLLGNLYLDRRVGDSERGRRDRGILWPLSGVSRGPDSGKRWIFPLYFGGDDRRGSTDLVFPLFARSDLETSGEGPFPGTLRHASFMGFERNRRSTPEEDDDLSRSHLLFSLVQWKHDRREGRRSFTFLPLGGWSRTEAGGVRRSFGTLFPILWYEKRQRLGGDGPIPLLRMFHLWPLFGYRSKPGQGFRELSTIYPLFRHARDRDADRTTLGVLWPLGEYQRSRSDRKLRAFPLLFSGRTDEGRYLNLFPIHSDRRGRTSHWSEWLPYLSVRETEPTRARYRALLGLVDWKRERGQDGEGDRTSFHIAKFLYRYDRDGRRSSHFLFPLLYSRRSERRGLFALFPLVFSDRNPGEPVSYIRAARLLGIYNGLEGSGGERHHSLLWKLWEKTRYGNGDRDFRILHKLFVSSDRDGYREEALNPIYNYERHPATDYTYLSILQFLYSYERKHGEAVHRVLHLIKIPGRGAGPE